MEKHQLRDIPLLHVVKDDSLKHTKTHFGIFIHGFTRISRYDLLLHRETLTERPLQFWHVEKDDVVPFAATYQFYKEILPLYEQSLEKIPLLQILVPIIL